MWHHFRAALLVETATKAHLRSRGTELEPTSLFYFILVYFILFYFIFNLFRAALMAYGGSQARGQIGAVATDLQHSHSNTGSEPCLGPTPQFTTVPDP